MAKLALIVLLVASLGLKARNDSGHQPIQEPPGIARLSTLSALGFALAENEGLQGPSWVANKGDCHIEITAVSPLGWHQAAMGARARGHALFYVYDGQEYKDQPVTLTKLGYYWHKLVNYFRPAGQQPLVFGVVTSAGCAGQSIDTKFLVQQLRPSVSSRATG